MTPCIVLRRVLKRTVSGRHEPVARGVRRAAANTGTTRERRAKARALSFLPFSPHAGALHASGSDMTFGLVRSFADSRPGAPPPPPPPELRRRHGRRARSRWGAKAEAAGVREAAPAAAAGRALAAPVLSSPTGRAGSAAARFCARARPRRASARTRATRTPTRRTPPRASPSPSPSRCGTWSSATRSGAAAASSPAWGAFASSASSSASPASPSRPPRRTASPPGLPPRAQRRPRGRGLQLEPPGRRPVRAHPLGRPEAPPVAGRRQPGELRQAVQAHVRGGAGGGPLHRGVQGRRGAPHEQVQVGPRVHIPQQRRPGELPAVHHGGGGHRDAEPMAHGGRAEARLGGPRRRQRRRRVERRGRGLRGLRGLRLGLVRRVASAGTEPEPRRGDAHRRRVASRGVPGADAE